MQDARAVGKTGRGGEAGVGDAVGKIRRLGTGRSHD